MQVLSKWHNVLSPSHVASEWGLQGFITVPDPTTFQVGSTRSKPSVDRSLPSAPEHSCSLQSLAHRNPIKSTCLRLSRSLATAGALILTNCKGVGAALGQREAADCSCCTPYCSTAGTALQQVPSHWRHSSYETCAAG